MNCIPEETSETQRSTEVHKLKYTDTFSITLAQIGTISKLYITYIADEFT